MDRWCTRFPVLTPLLTGADHVDVHAIESQADLRHFVAGLMGFEPSWVRFLFQVRAGFVRLLGMRQEGSFRAPQWKPEDVPMQEGQPASFFTVRLVHEGHVWAADVEERHLRAALCVVREAGRMSVVTVVHYRHWTGRVYFNVIRPFHHLVVRGMVLAGARASG